MSGGAELIYIESEGALYRGFSRGWPTQVWSRRERRFVPYRGDVPKPIEWGDEISEAEAINMMTGAMPTRTPKSSPRRRSGRGWS